MIVGIALLAFIVDLEPIRGFYASRSVLYAILDFDATWAALLKAESLV